ncbi:hypothetical protein ABBQ38_013632 [Trebouxia sp. C0009 RCD-2024]
MRPSSSSRDSARRAEGTRPQQGLGSLSSPAQITAYIKREKQKTVESLRHSQPGLAILAFCSSMQHLHCTAGPQMNYINLSAVIAALAHVWTAVQLHRKLQDDDSKMRSSIEAVCQQSLTQLQPMMQDMDVRGVINIVWSSAKLGQDPDEYVPGIMDTLTTMFLQLINAANMKRRPNAQDAANLVWALATMHHPAATSELLDCVCSHFGGLVQHPDAQQRPQAQNIANVLWALAELQHSPKDGRLLDDFCTYMHSLLQSRDARARPNAQEVENVIRALAVLKYSLKDGSLLDDFCMYMHSLLHSRDARARPNVQEVANTLWALAVLQHPLKDGRLLDDFCKYINSLLQSQDARAHPNAQETANALWALGRMKHAPPSEVAFAMLDHLVALCQAPGLQPKPQATSNCFLACAELSLDICQAQVAVLFKHMLEPHVTKVEYQVYSNTAWSLAVMGCLDISMFDALLHQFTMKHKLLGEHGTHSTSAQPGVEGAQQLHQALEWLKFPEGSGQMEAWSSLRSRLQAVAPAPQCLQYHFSRQTELYDALASLRLHYQPMVPCGMYQADAVLSPHGSSGPQVILMLQRSKYFVRNVRSRLLGSVAFRLKMLGRYGTVVTVPDKQGRSSVESMAGAIKAAVEDKTGLPLDSFHQ